MNKAILILIFSIITLGAYEPVSIKSYDNKIKEKKIYPMGKKIFEKKCDHNVEFEKYNTIEDLENFLESQNVCKPLKQKHYEALLIYLWDVKIRASFESEKNSIDMDEKDKCPVCGMFVYKYKKWAAQIVSGDTRLSFDGVKDMMKFYFYPDYWGDFKVKNSDDIDKILVTDYYSQKVIDAKEAYYVIGSDIYGPMGDELIPFKSKSDAKTFSMDHKGRVVVKFEDITKEQVNALDE